MASFQMWSGMQLRVVLYDIMIVTLCMHFL